MKENFEGVLKFLRRKFREAQADSKKLAKVNVMDLAWILDTLEYIQKKQEEAE